jgi:hypothetical protein
VNIVALKIMKYKSRNQYASKILKTFATSYRAKRDPSTKIFGYFMAGCKIAHPKKNLVLLSYNLQEMIGELFLQLWFA